MPDDVQTAAVRLAGYIDGLRREGALDRLSAGHLANIDRYLVNLGEALGGAGRFGGVTRITDRAVPVADLREGDLFVWGDRVVTVTHVMPAASKRPARYINTIETGGMVRRLHYWDTERVTIAEEVTPAG